MAAEHVNGGAPRDVLKGAAAGAIGGLVASWAMTRFTSVWTRLAAGHESQSAGGEHDARDWQERSEDQNATELVAERAAELTIGRPLTRDEMSLAAPIVHYLFGISMGAVYGAAVEAIPSVNPLTGAAWGTVVYLGADTIGMPALGLSEGPQQYTPELYAQGFAAHVVYGVTTDVVRNVVRRLM